MASEIKKIGVIGAGQMGKGIAHVCAVAGYEVYLLDIGADIVKKAVSDIEKSMDRRVSRDEISKDDKAKAVKRITGGTDYKGFKDCDLVIEAAAEDEQVKKEILKKLCETLPKNAVIASNTSSISITRLGAQTDRPGKFVGMHFMNPVPRMQLVEMIRGIATEEDTYRAVTDLAKKLGK
ncbi:MAG: 3-hydroxyacyl-CoA dehydrogenase NAD-binding domain-containing protein, partial [Rhodospirillales bacterium]